MKVSIQGLHHETKDAIRQVQFYKEEIAILGKRIEEVAAKNTASEVLAQVEHFHNKFNLYQVECHDLNHELEIRLEKAQKMATELPTHTHEKFIEENEELQNKVDSFVRAFSDTRRELNKFLAKVF
jgi:hypothetical protein